VFAAAVLANDEAIEAFKSGDVEKGIEILKRSCEDGNASNCNVLGSLYKNGYGVKRDYSKAVEFYKKACEGGFTKSCVALGLMYEFGKGAAKDKNRALELYKKTCNSNDQDGCENYKRAVEGKNKFMSIFGF
jgi:TPR repeat protein